jgi:hypothetical protein
VHKSKVKKPSALGKKKKIKETTTTVKEDKNTTNGEGSREKASKKHRSV